jgi:origin recognition complex subunit 1
MHCSQGGEDWASGKRKAVLGLGAAGIPASVRARAATPLETARAALALMSAPKSMPCREQERTDIMRFVEEAVRAGAPNLCLPQQLCGATCAHLSCSATALKRMANCLEALMSSSRMRMRLICFSALHTTSGQPHPRSVA